ncbi:MAG: hypothetical protein WBE18_06635 [Gammaproteobacteria bacterium]
MINQFSPTHNNHHEVLLFKKIIVIFWTIWWIIALWTDIVGTFAHLSLIHQTWAPDTNYPYLAESLKIYHTPSWLVTIFFIGILLWSAVSTVAFIIATCSLGKPSEVWLRRAGIAFIISITYWFAFFIADQMVMKFDLEENHMVQGGLQLLCYLSLYLLPPCRHGSEINK